MGGRYMMAETGSSLLVLASGIDTFYPGFRALSGEADRRTVERRARWCNLQIVVTGIEPEYRQSKAEIQRNDKTEED